MTNAQINAKFLAVIAPATRRDILTAIANHYGIDNAAAYAEVTDAEAEHLLDYLTGSVRTATHFLMRSCRLSA
jgi:hypothetical protein